MSQYSSWSPRGGGGTGPAGPAGANGAPGPAGAAGPTIMEIDGFIEIPLAKTYPLVMSSTKAFTIGTMVAKMAAGTCTATVFIDGVAVTGLTALALTSVKQTFTATAANVISTNSAVSMVISAPSSTQDLSFTIGGV